MERLFASYAIATRHNDGSTRQVVFGFLYMSFEYLNDIRLRADVFRYHGIHHLAFRLALIQRLLHHSRTHGSHLWTMIGVDDGGHDVATKGRSDLIKQIVIVLLGFTVVVVANLQLRTISRQPTGER